jgi:hypothetical protein
VVLDDLLRNDEKQRGQKMLVIELAGGDYIIVTAPPAKERQPSSLLFSLLF